MLPKDPQPIPPFEPSLSFGEVDLSDKHPAVQEAGLIWGPFRPQQNYLGVLIDDSRSMQIADVDGQPRASYVKSEFGASDRGVLKALSERFTVRTFRFSNAATRTTQESDLTFGG